MFEIMALGQCVPVTPGRRYIKIWTCGVILLGLFFSGCGHTTKHGDPEVRKGAIDLTTWDFNTRGPANLNGDWAFYWGQLLSPANFESSVQPVKTGYFSLPGLWNGSVVNGTPLSATGYATFRLKITLANTPAEMALYLGNPLSVCRVWINGKSVGQSGIPGKNRGTETPQAHSLMPDFTVGDGELDIILQISNHHNVQGGIRTPILLGTEDQIHWDMNKNLIITAVLSGAIFVLCLYHLGFYLYRRSDYVSLYFGLYCLMTAVSTAFGDRGTCLVATFVKSLPWHLSIDLSLMPHGLTVPLLVMFYHSLFPYKHGRVVEWFYQITGGLFIIYLLVTPTNAFDRIVLLYRLISLTVIPYLFFRFIVDLKQKSDSVTYLIPGYLFLCIAAVNDSLFDEGLINTTLLGQYATIVLVLSYSFLISVRLSRAYASVKELSTELDKNKTRLRSLEDAMPDNKTIQTASIHKPGIPDKRSLGVRVMNLTVDHWVTSTQTTKVELADQSGLWSIYFEKDGFARTQTLDKYLSEGTLPSRPRWKTIIHTADFVLKTCPEPSQLKDQLAESLKLLKHLKSNG